MTTARAIAKSTTPNPTAPMAQVRVKSPTKAPPRNPPASPRNPARRTLPRPPLLRRRPPNPIVNPTANKMRRVAVSLIALALHAESIPVPGLQKPVEILRDRWGVPHIYAKTEADLFFAQGYITAKDRLFQIALCRRIGTGKPPQP